MATFTSKKDLIDRVRTNMRVAFARSMKHLDDGRVWAALLTWVRFVSTNRNHAQATQLAGIAEMHSREARAVGS